MDAATRNELFSRLELTPNRVGRLAGVDRKTALGVLEGGGTAEKIKKVDDALIRAAREGGVPLPPGVAEASLVPKRTIQSDEGGEPLIEFEVTGLQGVSVVVRAAVGNADEAERAVVRLIQSMNAGE